MSAYAKTEEFGAIENFQVLLLYPLILRVILKGSALPGKTWG